MTLQAIDQIIGWVGTIILILAIWFMWAFKEGDGE